MAFVVPNDSEQLLLKYILGIETPGNLWLRLFVDAITPDEDTTELILNEPSGRGYAAIELVGAWTVSTDPGDNTTAVHPTSTFTFTAGAEIEIYGNFLTDASGNLILVERFAGNAFPVPAGGSDLNIDVEIGLN